MSAVPIISLSSPLEVNDWFLSVTMLTLILMLVIMGPYRYVYMDSFSSMFRFKTPDGDVRYPLLSTTGIVMLFILSCFCVGITVSIYTHDIREEGLSVVLFLLRFSSLAVVAFLLRLLLYTTVNKILFERQIITLKPTRWNCFFVMSFSVAGLLILLFSMLVFLLNLSLVLLLVFSALMRILVITGRIFKIKTTLFKNRRTNSGFIMYLCAFELAPVFLEFVLLNRFFSLI